jgi:hypothetical protein
MDQNRDKLAGRYVVSGEFLLTLHFQRLRVSGVEGTVLSPDSVSNVRELVRSSNSIALGAGAISKAGDS